MRSILIIAFLAALGSCVDNKKHSTYSPIDIELHNDFAGIHLDRYLSTIIDSFVKVSNCDNCIMEMYIDKVYSDSTVITLKSKAVQSYNLNPPLFSSIISGKRFYIYSGIEDIFLANKKSDSKVNSADNPDKHWMISVITDVSSKQKHIIIDTFGYTPFFRNRPAIIEFVK